ncbi:MAG: ArsR/SmtB family transcription factor [Rudaea sp.]
MPQTYRESARVLRLLAHPARLQLLEALLPGEQCVCHLTALLGRRQAYVSQHLGGLRRAGLIAKRKEGLRVYYHISNPRLSAVLTALLPGRPSLRMLRAAPGCHCPHCLEEGGRDGNQNPGPELRQLPQARNARNASPGAARHPDGHRAKGRERS